jgi:hypothetical protein
MVVCAALPDGRDHRDRGHMTTETPEAAPRRHRPSHRVTAAVLVVAGILAVVSAVVGWQWWHNPNVFYPVSSNVDEGRTWRVGTATTFGMTYVKQGVGAGTVSVTSVHPNVLVNTANATITVLACTPNRAEAGAVGIVGGELHRWCTSVTQANGATLRVGGSAPDQLVMTVVPRQPGTVLVRGLHVTYTHGWQRGPEDIGMYVRLRAN